MLQKLSTIILPGSVAIEVHSSEPFNNKKGISDQGCLFYGILMIILRFYHLNGINRIALSDGIEYIQTLCYPSKCSVVPV
jgi:hypothetical protein